MIDGVNEPTKLKLEPESRLDVSSLGADAQEHAQFHNVAFVHQVNTGAWNRGKSAIYCM